MKKEEKLIGICQLCQNAPELPESQFRRKNQSLFGCRRDKLSLVELTVKLSSFQLILRRATHSILNDLSKRVSIGVLFDSTWRFRPRWKSCFHSSLFVQVWACVNQVNYLSVYDPDYKMKISLSEPAFSVSSGASFNLSRIFTHLMILEFDSFHSVTNSQSKVENDFTLLSVIAIFDQIMRLNLDDRLMSVCVDVNLHSCRSIGSEFLKNWNQLFNEEGSVFSAAVSLIWLAGNG